MDSNIRFNTVCAEYSRFAASGITRLLLLSITASETIILRLTGTQCIKNALSVMAIFSESTVQLRSVVSIFP